MTEQIQAAFLVGPTAVGKTALAVAVGETLAQMGREAHIISCDSRQIFRGMDVGTAKPTAEERRRIVHHLVDVAEPDEKWSAGRWAAEAGAVLHHLAGRRCIALVVGGSGLYCAALRRGLAAIPSDEHVRRRLQAQCAELGSAELHRRLALVDPVAARGIHPRNRERIVRALEVQAITGRPISTFWRDDDRRPLRPEFAAPVFGIRAPWATLRARIDARTEQMMAGGLLQEARALASRGFGPEWPSFRTLGYPEALLCVAGEVSPAETVVTIQQRTRRFARRQLTWFRAEPALEWIDHPGDEVKALALELARRILDAPVASLAPREGDLPP